MYLHRMITSEENGQLGAIREMAPIVILSFLPITVTLIVFVWGMIIMLFLLPFNIPRYGDHTFQGFGELDD